jgi:conjugal transfer ATP-binding protein TraC
LRQLSRGTQVFVIDPDNEYEELAKSVGGTFINLSADSEHKINPFDVTTTARDGSQIREHAQDLIEIIARMVANPEETNKAPALTSEERADLDEIILNLYSDTAGTPLLKQFRELAYKKGLVALCKKLDKYLSGTQEGIFNRPTNVKLDNRLVVFGIKDLQESTRQAMMMVVSTFIQNKVRTQPQKRILVIDEGWILLRNEESARFMEGLVRRARKYYLGVSIISQQANDFLDNKYGKAIASQSPLRILLHQDTTSIKRVTEEFGLSEYEKEYLTEGGVGDALIIADQHHVAVQILASKKEYPLITTNPAEISKKSKVQRKRRTPKK